MCVSDPPPCKYLIVIKHIILLLCVYAFNVFSGPDIIIATDTRVAVIGEKKSNEQLMISQLELRTVEKTYLFVHRRTVTARRTYLLWVRDRGQTVGKSPRRYHYVGIWFVRVKIQRCSSYQPPTIGG